MTAVIDALWQQIEPIVFITREQFERGLEDWTIEAVERDGALAFAALTRGPEFHFASFGTGTPISLRMIRERVDPLIEAHGFVLTRTPRDERRQQRLNEALGFFRVAEDEFFLHYRMDVPIWHRRQQCQS